MDQWTPSAAFLGLAILACASTGFGGDGALGLFEAHGDVGTVGQQGSVVYDANAGTYRSAFSPAYVANTTAH